MISLRKLATCLLAASAFSSSAAQADIVVVNQVGFAFQPADITINVGDTVRWIRSGSSHTVTEGTDGAFNGNEAFHSNLNGATPVVEVVFDAALLAANPRPGNLYDYFCIPHFFIGMKGTVTVNVNSEPGVPFCDCSGGNSPCNNSGAVGAGCLNSSGVGAVLAGSGSTSATTDDIAFHGTGLAPNKPCLLFFGTAQQNGGMGLPFGDGLLCAGGQIQRMNVEFSNASGDANWGTGLNSGLWSAGDTRHFQIWYRDTAAGPCGNSFNVSNGYSVTFN